MLNFHKFSRKIIYSVKVSILLLLFLVPYSLSIDSVYAQNINIQIVFDNSLLKIDSILRIDKGIEARLYDYKTNQSSSLPPESQFLNDGLEQSSKKNFEEAIKSYTEALQSNPNFVKAHVSRAYARSQLGSREKVFTAKAFEDYNQALEIDPKLVAGLKQISSPNKA